MRLLPRKGLRRTSNGRQSYVGKEIVLHIKYPRF